MKDINDFRFSGIVERFDRIQTKTGTAMISFTVRCWRETIRAIAFKELAEQTELTRGDRIEVRGHIQTTTWTDKQGQLRSGWQCVASEIRITADDTDRQQEQPRPPARQEQAHQGNLFPERRQDTNARFQYQGGPF